MDTTREVLLKEINTEVFNSKMNESQKSGIERILNACELYGVSLQAMVAYILATSYHETGAKMQPVREGFARTDEEAIRAVANLFAKGKISKNYARRDPVTGKSYYGRGDVQLTFKDNYKKMGDILGLDLVNDPDKTLVPLISGMILVEGMTRGASNRGDFTSKALDDYVNSNSVDFVGARRVVNGIDKAEKIAGIAEKFLKAIKTSKYKINEQVLVDLGTRSDSVRKWQEYLKFKGKYNDVVDGNFGPMTKDATIAAIGRSFVTEEEVEEYYKEVTKKPVVSKPPIVEPSKPTIPAKSTSLWEWILRLFGFK